MSNKEQNELLIKMKDQIKDIEYQLSHVNSINKKIKRIRNLKIYTKYLQATIPYVLVAGATFSTFTLFGNMPFRNGDSWKKYSSVKNTLDTRGNIKYEQQYDYFKEANNELYYYGKWEKINDVFYTRTVNTYSIKNKSIYDILDLFKKDNLTLEDILEKPESSIKETKNNLTDKELNQDEYFEAIIFEVDKKDFIVHKETVGENIVFSALYLLLTIFGEIGVWRFRNNYSTFDIQDSIDKTKENNPCIDADVLIKKLEIEKNNYERLLK